MDPDRQLFLQIDALLKCGFGVMAFYLQDSTIWKEGQDIPSTAVQPILFLSCSLSNPELRYGASEMEVACLVWTARKLRTMLQSSRHPVIVLTDYSATKGIIEQTSLNITSTDQSNRRLQVALIYLSQYDLRIYHIAGRLNFVPDALSRLTTVYGASGTPKDMLPALDNVWLASKAVMTNDTRTAFTAAYTTDRKFKAVINYIQQDEDALNALKKGVPFELINRLLYYISPCLDFIQRLCIPHAKVKEILKIAYNEKHYFSIKCMLHDLGNLQIYKKTHRVKTYV